jgi:hypothetical protein
MFSGERIHHVTRTHALASWVHIQHDPNCCLVVTHYTFHCLVGTHSARSQLGLLYCISRPTRTVEQRALASTKPRPYSPSLNHASPRPQHGLQTKAWLQQTSTNHSMGFKPLPTRLLSYSAIPQCGRRFNPAVWSPFHLKPQCGHRFT